MIRKKSWVFCGSLTVAILTLSPACFAAADAGCAPDRSAVPHHAGGLVVALSLGQAKRAPIPCVTPTGWRTNEMGLAVTNAGTILIGPAFPEAGSPIGLIRSGDQGSTWSSIVPPNSPARLDVFDGNVGLDRGTGRAFWITPGYFDPSISETSGMWFSDDDGKTWSAGGNPTMQPPSGHADSMKIFAGPPTNTSKEKMKGYPNVLYNCGAHKPQRCQASYDGGLTWGPTVGLPFPAELAPIQGALNDCSAFGLNGVVGEDGTVYFGYTPCNRPYVAISRDEAQSWQTVQVANVETIGYGMAGVAIDRAGNLYSAWVAASDRLPYLAVSRDGGATWSTPMMIGAPGVNEAALPKVVAGKRGQVAVGYYGSENSPGAPFPPKCPGATNTCPAYQNETWNTYITESFDALSRQPLFWSASINDPAIPSSYGCTPSSTGVIRLDESLPFFSGGGYARGCWGAQDYFAMVMDRNDTPWVGFQQDCLGVPGNPNCPSTFVGTPVDRIGAPTGKFFAIAGRLVGSKGDDSGDGND